MHMNFSQLTFSVCGHLWFRTSALLA